MARRPVATNVQFSIGLVTLPADLMTTALTSTKKATSFSLICPECPTPTKPSQGYTCEHGHGPYSTGDITRRAKEVDGKLIEVSAAEIAALKDEDAPTKTFELFIYDAVDVEAVTLPDALTYQVALHSDAPPNAHKTYALLLELVSDPSKAFIGELVLKTNSVPKMARLTAFRGNLLVSTLVRPDDLAPAETVALIEPTDKERAQAAMLVSSMVEDFNPATYANKVRARAEALIAAKADDPNAVVAHIAAAAKPSSMDDLEALLEASIKARSAA